MFLCLSTPGLRGWVPPVMLSCAGTWLGKTSSPRLTFLCLLKEASYWPVGIKCVLYVSSKAARLSGLVPEQAKKNLLIANPLELTPSPLGPCRNLQSILLSFLTWDLLYHDIKLQLRLLQAAFYDSLQYDHFLRLAGLQFYNWVGKCT